MAQIFDTHTHYMADQFDTDRDEILSTIQSENVGLIVNCGTDFQDSKNCVALAEKYPFIYAAVGIHPESIIEETASTNTIFKGDWRAELKEMRTLFENKKVVAVGEAGLDYYWPIPKDEQLALFEAQIKLALELDKPIIIHDREAHEDTYMLLKKYKPKGVVHCYSGSGDDAKWLAAQGLYIGFGGVVTFKNARKAVEAVMATPLENLVIETDCPYMAPEPYRGKRCNSAMLSFVAEKIAEIKELTAEEILQTTFDNGKRLFAIK